ncbi:hypothetical protein [Streptomyces daliensis]|uniref:Uncharacterized protein n=1 Tax=Streptomyces daliensis TaxID=299421 RepID=A0A8T4IR41_9ACTN|nr:hypothetical protein [Streptomyces daliensis]
MSRTVPDHIRRASLADAATGRTAVVLYLCLAADADAASPLIELRRYAAARDWTVVAELVDRCGPETTLRDREQWPSLAELLVSGRAQGFVTQSTEMWSHRPGERKRVLDWAADHHTFVCTVRAEQAVR